MNDINQGFLTLLSLSLNVKMPLQFVTIYFTYFFLHLVRHLVYVVVIFFVIVMNEFSVIKFRLTVLCLNCVK